MPTQTHGYFLKDGTKVPSVTTVLGRFRESGGLLRWAYQTGCEHGRLRTEGKPCPRDLYDVSGRAADIGTAVHAMAEARVKGQDAHAELERVAPLRDPEFYAKALQAFGAFEAWMRMTRVEIIYTEVPVVSEKYRFGGTLDFIGRIDGKLMMGDFKTSNAVYGDHLAQIAAYREAWNETHPDEQLEPGGNILQFGKDHGDFAHHFYPDLESGWQMFMHLRAAYEFDRELKKRAA